MYISFLRAINVGGKNKIQMNELTKVYESLGFTQVKTYLNTGNILFESSLSSEDSVNLINKAIQETFDLDIEIIIRSKEALSKMIGEYPYGAEGKNRYVTLFKSDHKMLDEVKVRTAKKIEDEIKYTDKEVYLFIPGGYGKSKLTNHFFEKISETYATTRNMNTITKLYKMMGNNE